MNMVPNIIPEKIQRSHILKAIQDIQKHGYPPKKASTGYDLFYEGRRFPPKYVLSIAHKFVDGTELPTNDFFGGKKTNDFLFRRGFVIVPKSEDLEHEEAATSRDWSEQEVWDTVCSYMAMLKQELRRHSYNKTAYRNELLTKLNNRTQGAIERKHQNISAILFEIGLPYVDGYKPLGNY